MLTAASQDLKQLLEAIDAYEQFSRLLIDAFQDSLFELTRAQGRLAPGDLAGIRAITAAAEAIPTLFAEVRHRLEPFDNLAGRFEHAFVDVSERARPGRLGRTIDRASPGDSAAQGAQG